MSSAESKVILHLENDPEVRKEIALRCHSLGIETTDETNVFQINQIIAQIRSQGGALLALMSLDTEERYYLDAGTIASSIKTPKFEDGSRTPVILFSEGDEQAEEAESILSKLRQRFREDLGVMEHVKKGEYLRFIQLISAFKNDTLHQITSALKPS